MWVSVETLQTQQMATAPRAAVARRKAPRTFQTISRNVHCAPLVLVWINMLNLKKNIPHQFLSLCFNLQYLLPQIGRPSSDHRNVRLNPSSTSTDHKFNIAKLFFAQKTTKVVVQRASRIRGKLNAHITNTFKNPRQMELYVCLNSPETDTCRRCAHYYPQSHQICTSHRI